MIPKKAWLGVDPGKKGGIALVTEEGDVLVEDMPTLKVGKSKDEYDIQGQLRVLNGLMTEFNIVGAGLEKVHSMPKQGVASTFKFGEGYGINQACLYALGIPFDYITPQRWKKEMMHGIDKEKSASCLTASRLFPDHRDLFFTPRGRALDGRADAVLIAEFRRRMG